MDVRRGDGPRGAFDCTFPVVAATERLIATRPEMAAGVVRAVVATQAALQNEPSLAAQVGGKLFPPEEAALIEDIVARDLPYYNASIAPRSVAALNQLAGDVGLLDADPAYEDIVAVGFRGLWAAPTA